MSPPPRPPDGNARERETGRGRHYRRAFRSSLFLRLLGAFSGVALIALAVAAILWRWQFSAGVLDYMNRAEQQQVERVAQLIAVLIPAGGSVAALRPRDWPRFWTTGDGAPARAADRPRQPQRRERRPARALPPGGARDRGPPDPMGLERRVALFDERGRRVFGPSLSDPALEATAILVRGEQVGTLRRAPLREVGAGPERAFIEAQMRLALLSLLLVAALTTAAAWWFARRLAQPVRAVAAGARALAEHRYDIELGMTRSDEIGDLARDFDALARRLAAAEDARRRWMADIAHELRTPLTVLQGEIEALVDGVRTPDPVRLGSLESEIACLARLVEDLRTLTLSDQGALDYRMVPLSFREVLQSALVGTRKAARARELALVETIDGDEATLRGDPDRLLQLCHNLLCNAVEHTAPGGELQVELSTSGDRVCLTIDDSKPGVPATAMARLGTPLFRPDADRSRRTGGSGLGLAIVRRIVEAHAGDLAFEASRLGGLRVRVTLRGAPS